MTVMVGVDGSKANQAAVRWAAQLAHRTSRSLELVHVVDDALRTSRFITGDQIRYAADRVIEASAREARRVAPELEVLTQTVFGHPSSTLRELGQEADLFVVGRRGHSELAGLLLGSVSGRVAAKAAVPTAVIPKDWDSTSHQDGPVVVGIDEGSGSDNAVRYAVELANTLQVGVNMVHVWGPPDPYLYGTAWMEPPLDEWEKDAVDLVRGVAEPWQRKYPEVQIRADAIHGQVVVELVSAAQAGQVLVVGGRRISPMHGALSGSVMYGVLFHANCPVIVVPDHS